jgi:hypothetical protein
MKKKLTIPYQNGDLRSCVFEIHALIIVAMSALIRKICPSNL